MGGGNGTTGHGKPVSKVRVELQQEYATRSDPARITIFDGDEVLYSVTARVEMKPGFDGGRYPCVTLTEHKLF